MVAAGMGMIAATLVAAVSIGDAWCCRVQYAERAKTPAATAYCWPSFRSPDSSPER